MAEGAVVLQEPTTTCSENPTDRSSAAPRVHIGLRNLYYRAEVRRASTKIAVHGARI